MDLDWKLSVSSVPRRLLKGDDGLYSVHWSGLVPVVGLTESEPEPEPEPLVGPGRGENQWPKTPWRMIGKGQVILLGLATLDSTRSVPKSPSAMGGNRMETIDGVQYLNDTVVDSCDA